MYIFNLFYYVIVISANTFDIMKQAFSNILYIILPSEIFNYLLCYFVLVFILSFVELTTHELLLINK